MAATLSVPVKIVLALSCMLPSPPPHEAKLHATGGTHTASTWSEFGVLNVAFASLSFSPFSPGFR